MAATTKLMKVLAAAAVVVLVVFAGTTTAIITFTGDRPCGPGNDCLNNMCCSADGKCGLGRDYCGAGCQSGICYSNDDKRCGKDFSNAKCSNGYCCSVDGYCGLGYRYCGITGCQSDFGGTCTTDVKRCDAGTNKCPNNLCCGTSSLIVDPPVGQECGAGPAYCRDQNNKKTCVSGPCEADRNKVCGTVDNPKCANGYCCGSSTGPVCGLGEKYCCKGCVHGAGECCSQITPLPVFDYLLICPVF